jgi:hypothetical protein
MNRRQFLCRSLAASGTALLTNSARGLEFPARIFAALRTHVC